MAWSAEKLSSATPVPCWSRGSGRGLSCRFRGRPGGRAAWLRDLRRGAWTAGVEAAGLAGWPPCLTLQPGFQVTEAAVWTAWVEQGLEQLHPNTLEDLFDRALMHLEKACTP